MLSGPAAITGQLPGRSSYANSIDTDVYDPASNSIFQNYKKHDDLKQMLDSNKDSLKLEAMKRIIGMIAKGKDASDLFPAVVKNVVSKNIEVKKLVYVFLVRYAEEQQDLALLSISTFQRALKDPNQLIRASALRVLSSIRVSLIVPIVMLSIKDAAQDMSPYVRKTAAHAIPKLYNLDPEQKEELILVIEKLLSDRTTLVVGSAVMAYEEVCPERIELIHKNYRKLCNLLVDVDEWGQLLIINMLTRYARTQFTDPNIEDEVASDQEDKPFYDGSSESEKSFKKPTYTLDPDHRLLLRQTKPLLQSRNAAVVMAVAQLYHHVAPKNDVTIVAKALIRLLRNHTEVQSVVLTCIASMTLSRKAIFEPFLKFFFVRTCDPTHIKLLKLDIMTNLANEGSIAIILREFQTYISSNDREFVAATIQGIGRCAATINEVTETCLSGLVHLLSNRDEHVVAEAVVVIKKLLQSQNTEHRRIITQMSKLLDFITVPAARASILWLIGEYNEHVPKIAPDVLRKMAKSFVDEENGVKLQVLNLAVKLFLNNPQQTELLCQHIFNLAKYDVNYDIRDRARFLKPFVFCKNPNSPIIQNAKKIFLATKKAPQLESKYTGRESYQLGSMSHFLNQRVNGYQPLPDFPTTAPDASVRNVESPTHERSSNDSINKEKAIPMSKKYKNSKKSFYSESESDEDASSSSESSDEASDSDEIVENNKNNNNNNHESEDSESDSSSSTESDSESESESDNDEKETTAASATKQTPKKSNLDLLLDLDEVAPVSTVMTPSLGGFLTPMTPVNPQTNKIELVGPSYVANNTMELLNKVNGYGLGITYKYTRAPHLFSSNMISIELHFTNHGNVELCDIQCGAKNLASGMTMNEFAPIGQLMPKQTLMGILGIDFNDSSQAANFDVKSTGGTSKVTIKPPIGELMRSVTLSEAMFKEERGKLRGMSEATCKVQLKAELCDKRAMQMKIYEIANVAAIDHSETNDLLLFAGQTMNSKSLVLISIEFTSQDTATVTVNCEKVVIGSILINEIKDAIKKI
ncbi:hypothetical protein PVAND_015726 [Polypedilum vanderplanki]|uniref:AP-3 complex subunit beta n=1 Tax=Polypedilum vanderplanki TaxID=319348 RepID=A0A9J6BD36_POLVA|nr:hypothetical protein PVAND_015726 [Polypedilum vanderplanki]